jgi:hypothetical protein
MNEKEISTTNTKKHVQNTLMKRIEKAMKKKERKIEKCTDK